MPRPFFLTRASIGLAASVVELAVELPGRALGAAVALPAVPVRVAGSLVQTYLHAGQAVAELAVKGDRVLEAAFPARADQPGWATFDEDLAEDGDEARVDPDGPGSGGDGPGIPTGRVTPRTT
jgi:hypothetical protein